MEVNNTVSDCSIVSVSTVTSFIFDCDTLTFDDIESLTTVEGTVVDGNLIPSLDVGVENILSYAVIAGVDVTLLLDAVEEEILSLIADMDIRLSLIAGVEVALSLNAAVKEPWSLIPDVNLTLSVITVYGTLIADVYVILSLIAGVDVTLLLIAGLD